MHYVYFSSSSKNSINSAASQSSFVIGNYSLAALTPKYLHGCYSISCTGSSKQGSNMSASRNRVSSLCLSYWLPHMNFPHISCLSLTFMYLTVKWLLEERSAIHWRRFLNSKRRRVNKAFQIFHWNFWPKAWNHESLFFFFFPPPLVGSLNFIAQSYCSVMCIRAVWEAASDWQAHKKHHVDCLKTKALEPLLMSLPPPLNLWDLLWVLKRKLFRKH